MVHRELEVQPDAEAAAARAAAVVAERALDAIARGGSFTIAVSGGSTPRRMFELLTDATVEWERVSLYQVDERIAPDGDPDRNLTMLRKSFGPLDRTAFHAMPVTATDAEAAAAEYARSLPATFDLVHLGLGPDGHTASLVPGDPVLDVVACDVAITGEYQGRRRMTVTYPVLDRASEILWVVTGTDKVDALRRLIEGDRSIPAGRVAADRQLVIADAEAAPEA